LSEFADEAQVKKIDLVRGAIVAYLKSEGAAEALSSSLTNETGTESEISETEIRRKWPNLSPKVLLRMISAKVTLAY